MNKVLLTGRLGRDADLSYTAGGTALCKLSVCTSENKKQPDGSYKEENVQWHRVTTWGKLAEKCGALRKGTEVFVDGDIRYSERDGKYFTDINSFNVKPLGRFEAVANQPSPQSPAPSNAPSNYPVDEDSDLPF